MRNRKENTMKATVFGRKKWVVLLAAIIFLVFMLSLVHPEIIDSTFGYASIGSNKQDNGGGLYMLIDKFTMPESGNIKSITAYISASPIGEAKAYIYADNSGSPSTLLNVSRPVLVSTPSWYSFPIDFSNVAGEKTLWIGVYANTTITQYFDDGLTNQQAYKAALSYNGFPNPFSADGFQDFKWSIYATYTAGNTSNNYADIPSYWLIGEIWNAPSYLDYDVTHNGNPSIRMEKGLDDSKSREILAQPISIEPGDHIVFSVWMKTSTSSIGDNNSESGVRLGIDFKNDGNRITGSNSLDGSVWTPLGGYPSNGYLNYVKWGSDWELRTMDFIVPNQYVADGLSGGHPAGTMATPDTAIPWIQVWSNAYENADNGTAWFADAEFYVNPLTKPIQVPEFGVISEFQLFLIASFIFLVVALAFVAIKRKNRQPLYKKSPQCQCLFHLCKASFHLNMTEKILPS
jgi:hypothetical protein